MCSSSRWVEGEARTAAASSSSTLSSIRPVSDGAGSSPETGGGGTRIAALRKKPAAGARSGPLSEAGTQTHEGSCDAARSAKA
eukprot:CAMPEP_0118836558 /NCGR_PEP_ID=MMETSP1162-20130426/59238_1 /TAXON_ID=33656 /ORGANISM="Phaeocystis Sp, Strain CCMP2710" /LENGTH=82 /DNA_ID=CAMNT_0006768385 /DNA_START=22 /DNA_END=266 /DNA_ORIENTATION=-